MCSTTPANAPHTMLLAVRQTMVKLSFAAPCFRPISTSTSKAISLVSSLRIFKLLCGHCYSFPSGAESCEWTRHPARCGTERQAPEPGCLPSSPGSGTSKRMTSGGLLHFILIWFLYLLNIHDPSTDVMGLLSGSNRISVLER